MAGVVPSELPTQSNLALVILFLCDPDRATKILDAPSERLCPYIDQLKSDGVWHCTDEDTEAMLVDILEDHDFLLLLRRLCPCFKELHQFGGIESLRCEIEKWGFDFESQRQTGACQEQNRSFADAELGRRWRDALNALFGYDWWKVTSMAQVLVVRG